MGCVGELKHKSPSTNLQQRHGPHPPAPQILSAPSYRYSRKTKSLEDEINHHEVHRPIFSCYLVHRALHER